MKKNPFNDKQSKLMKRLGLKDTQRVVRITMKIHKRLCEDCKIKMQKNPSARYCDDCWSNTEALRGRLLKIKKKMRG